MNITLGFVTIIVSGAVLWLLCILKGRDFMKLGTMCIENSKDVSPEIFESRRAQMGAFHRAASWINLASFATIFATMAASQIYLAIMTKP